MGRGVARWVSVAVVLASVTARADDTDTAVRARFTTRQQSDAIERAVCGLIGGQPIRGKARMFDMRLGDRRCTSTPMDGDALVVRVTVEPREDGANDVVVAMDPIADVPAEQTRATVDDLRVELEVRLGVRPPRNPPPFAPEKPAVERPPSTLHTLGIVSAVTGGAGIGAGLLVGLGSLVVGAFENTYCLTGQTCSADVSVGLAAAGGLLGAGAAFLITGAICLVVAPRSTATAYVTPGGGGIRVTF